MATELTLNNSDEFQDMVDRKDFIIAKSIVEAILANINTRKKHVHILSINCIDDNSTYDITLEKRYFIDTLQENLKYYVEKELYEDCSKITKAINNLTNKENGIESTNTSKTKKTQKKKTGDSL
jgi:hypothetical protein